MNFLADESVEGPVVKRLRRDRHKVYYVSELSPGLSDESVLNEANKLNAILITSDKDFGELVFRQNRVSSGVLLIRLSGLTNKTKALIVSKVIKGRKREITGNFTVISPSTVRIRSQI